MRLVDWRMGLAGRVVLVAVVMAALIVPAGVRASATGGAAEVVRAAETPQQVRLLTSDRRGVTLALSAPDFELAALDAAAAAGGGSCRQAQAAGFVQSEEAGRPQLPTKVVLLGVPPNVDLTLDVVTGATRTIASGVSLCTALPVPSAEGRGEQAGSYAAKATPDPAVYDVDAFYPSQAARLVDLGFMRSQRIIRLEIYPVQYNPVSRELRGFDHIEVAVRFAAQPGLPAGEPVVEPQEFEAAFRRSLLNYEEARAWRGSAGPAAAAAAAAAWTPPEPGYKVLVREEGIYQITPADLAAAGVDDGGLDPRTLRMFNDGREIAIRVIGEEDGKLDAGDAMLFFGQGADTRYTDTNVYWLTYGSAPGLRMAGRPSQDGGPTASSYFASIKKEENTVYDSDLPEVAGHDHWFGQQISAAGANKTSSTSIAIATPELATGALSASVSVMLGAITTGSHHVRIYVNSSTYPTSVWDGKWDGINSVHLISASFPQGYLSSTGDNVIKIELINDQAGRPADLVRVDWVRVGYQRAHVAAENRLLFGGDAPGAWRYRVDGFDSTDVELYDVTYPERVVRITGASVGLPVFNLYVPLAFGQGAGATPAGSAAPAAAGPSAPTYRLRFGDNQATPRRYLAQVPSERLSPLGIIPDEPSDLQAPATGADYLIITHGDFSAAVQPLADLRSSQGMRVQVVDVQDIYDEFGGGLMSAEAIRDFIAYAYENWARPAPRSVLLVGDGTYDFRHYRYSTATFLPPYLDMVDPDAGETAADNRFVAVTAGDSLPDLDIGRLPANSVAEATAMVNKILAYEAQGPGDWMRQIAFVADDLEGGGGNFYEYSDAIADGSASYAGGDVKVLPAGNTAHKIYLGQTCDLANPTLSVECRAEIVNRINAGALLVSYIGHGTKTYWALERLFDGVALASVENTDRLTIMLPMTCNEGYFLDPAETSLSELGVRAENKGTIASWSATGYGLAPGHDFLEKGLFLALFYDGVTLGAAATQGKLYLAANAPPGKYADLIDTFLLLGDPALHVPVQ